MPYFKLQTNKAIGQEAAAELAGEISRLVSEVLGKPEKFIMVSVQAGQNMLFAGSDAPLVFIEMKSIGLPGTKMVSEKICAFIEEKLGVPKDRTYIEFADSPRHMFGWNGGTFEK